MEEGFGEGLVEKCLGFGEVWECLVYGGGVVETFGREVADKFLWFREDGEKCLKLCFWEELVEIDKLFRVRSNEVEGVVWHVI